MDILIFIIGELLYFLAVKGIRNIKNEKTQIIVAAIFTVVVCVSVTGFAGWEAIQFYQKGNMLAAIVFAILAVLPILLIGFIILRRIIRTRKNK